MNGIRVTHNGGVWPAGHPLAGQTVGDLTIYDLRRQLGAPDRGEPRGYGFDIVWSPNESRNIPMIPEVLTSVDNGQLRKYDDLGVITVTELLEQQWFELQDQIQYDPDVYNPAGGVTVETVTTKITDADGKDLLIHNVTEVTVRIAADAPGASTLALPDGTPGTGAGVGATIVVPFTYGVASSNVIVTAVGGVGAVVLDLVDSGGTGLDVSDTATINYT